MWDLIKRYWDILGGFVMGIVIALLAKFKLDKIQLVYSIIILILVLIGVMRIIKKSVDESRKNPKKMKRKKTVIDGMVDGQKPVKAISIAENPTKEGEKLGNLLIETMKGAKRKMKKLKTFFDKFKGIILSILLGILTLVEYIGGYINELFHDKLEVKGIEVFPAITLVCAILVGILSNTFTTEQWAKIKALFSKSSTNELVQQEIKLTLKKKQSELTAKNKELDTAENSLCNLNAELENLKNTYNAKVEMMNMTPQLATEEDVRNALADVNAKEAEITAKEAEIANINSTIVSLNTIINSLKSQLQ